MTTVDLPAFINSPVATLDRKLMAIARLVPLTDEGWIEKKRLTDQYTAEMKRLKGQ